jgi:chromosome segregation ATPase
MNEDLPELLQFVILSFHKIVQYFYMEIVMNVLMTRTSKSTAVALMSAFFISTGCGPKGAYKSAETTSAELMDTRTEVLAVRTAADTAAATFSGLVNNPRPDLKPQYATFSKAVDDLNKRADDAAERANDLRQKRDQYIKDWKADTDAISDPELKTRAIERMSETQKSFEAMSRRVQDVRDTLQPFVKTMNNLRQYLGGDLTSAGIASVADQRQRVNTQRDELKQRLDALVSEIDRVDAQLKPGAPETPAKR